MRRVSGIVGVAVGAIGLFTGFVLAGDVNPPAGPVAGTMKTLQEVEPRIPIGLATTPGNSGHKFIVSQPGSYYLTGNITADPAKGGIRFTAPNVTLDLNGFTLDGEDVGTFAITTSSTAANAVVRNGHITDWASGGVDFSSIDDALIEDLSSSGNGGTGLRVGVGGRVINSTARSNTSFGIDIGRGASAIGCVASSNGADGFNVSVYCVLSECRAEANAGSGFDVLRGGSLRNCTSYDNDISGFVLLKSTSITDSTAVANTVSGFNLRDGSRASGCIATINVGAGFVLGNGSHAVDCVADTNEDVGFDMSVASGSSLLNCSAYNNFSHGVHAGQNTLVRGGIMSSNSALALDDAGVFVASNDARIEGVHAIDNRRGIHAAVVGSLIINCSGSGNAFSPQIDSGPAIDGPAISVDPTDQAHGNFNY